MEEGRETIVQVCSTHKKRDGSGELDTEEHYEYGCKEVQRRIGASLKREKKITRLSLKFDEGGGGLISIRHNCLIKGDM